MVLTKLQTALRLLPPAAQRTDSAGQRLASLNPEPSLTGDARIIMAFPWWREKIRSLRSPSATQGGEASLGYKTPCLKKQKVKELLNSNVRLVNRKV